MGDGILLGFDIGGTKSAVAIGDEGGAIFERFEVATGEPEQTMGELLEAARGMVAGRGLAGCGVSCGSPLSREEGLILGPPNLRHWAKVGVRGMIREVFDVGVNLENDADAGALAEWRWGLGRRLDDVVYMTCGTGQGAGLVLGGRLHRGACNLAGEIGHVRLLPLGPVGCNKAGSVEGLTSGRGLGELAKLRMGEPHGPSELDRYAIEELDGRAVGEAALAGDALAEGVVREVGRHLGHACAILIDVLNPQRISLGSLAVRLGGMLLEEVRRAAAEEAMERSFGCCAIEAAALGERVQDLGALAAAMEGMGGKSQ